MPRRARKARNSRHFIAARALLISTGDGDAGRCSVRRAFHAAAAMTRITWLAAGMTTALVLATAVVRQARADRGGDETRFARAGDIVDVSRAIGDTSGVAAGARSGFAGVRLAALRITELGHVHLGGDAVLAGHAGDDGHPSSDRGSTRTCAVYAKEPAAPATSSRAAVRAEPKARKR